ncbi:MAG: response regulator [Acidiferrobacterales bacterium]
MKTGLVVDDSGKTGVWIGNLLKRAFPEIRVEICSTYSTALKIITSSHFGIMLIDINLPNHNGIDLINHIRQHYPDSYVVASTIHDDNYHLINSLKAGAQGYLLKDMAEVIYINKLQGIINGDPPLSPSVARKILRFISAEKPTHSMHNSQCALSPRETEVLTFIAKGYNRKEIANILDLSANTIARYIRDVYHRLNISNKAEATIEACRLGLVDPLNLH